MNIKLSSYKILLYLFLWLMVGISTGLSVILGPIHWAGDLVQAFHLDQQIENLIATLIIILYIIITARIAAWLLKQVISNTSIYIKGGIILLCSFFGINAAWLLFNPSDLPMAASRITFYNANIAFGGYPDKKLLKQLKQQDYTIISLLNGSKFLVEALPIETEKRNAAELGLTVLNYRMLPWLMPAQNKQIAESIVNLLKSTHKRYYIHCYLGKDRTRLVMKAIEEIMPSYKKLSLTSPRIYTGMRYSINGPIISLSKKIFMGPNLLLPDGLPSDFTMKIPSLACLLINRNPLT